MVTLMKHVSTEKKSQDERIVIYYCETWWKALVSFQNFFLLKEIKIFRGKKQRNVCKFEGKKMPDDLAACISTLCFFS